MMTKPTTTPLRPRHRAALAAALLATAAGATAGDSVPECRLYIAEAVDHGSGFTYTFDHGSSLRLRLEGGRARGSFEGDYTVVGGTGDWAGAIGAATIRVPDDL